jgi:cell division protein ZapA
MSSVNVTINGKNYRMACEEGQEDHLRSLAEKLDSYVGQLKGSFGEIGDQRLTVMAGILVTDELTELKKRFEKMERELSKLTEKEEAKDEERLSSEAEVSDRIADFAKRIETLAETLSSSTKTDK